jgi:hypothetical protein
MLIYYAQNFRVSGYVYPYAQTSSSGVAVWSDLINDGNQRGLFDSSGNPRIAAQCLRILYLLLSDPSINANNFVPGFLNYSVSGLPTPISGSPNTGYNDLLLQGNDGMFTLVIWNEQQLNQTTGNQLLTVAPVNVTLTFNEATMIQVDVFDPFQPMLGFSPIPVQSQTNVKSMTISLPAHVLFVRIRHP